MIKQFVVRPAFDDNETVTTYIDGVSEGFPVTSSRTEIDKYCGRLQEQGYTEAFDLDEMRKEMEILKEAYDLSKRLYDEAIPFALVKPDNSSEED